MRCASQRTRVALAETSHRIARPSRAARLRDSVTAGRITREIVIVEVQRNLRPLQDRVVERRGDEGIELGDVDR